MAGTPNLQRPLPLYVRPLSPLSPHHRALRAVARLPLGERLLVRSGLWRDKEVRRCISVAELERQGGLVVRRLATTLSYAHPAIAHTPGDLAAPTPPLELARGPDRYSTWIGDATAIGGSAAVALPGLRALYELPAHDRDQRFAYTEEAFFGCDGNHCIVRRAAPRPALPRAIHLCGNYSRNYYHFLFEIAPRLLLLPPDEVPADVPLLIDEAVVAIPQFAELFGALNQPRRAVVALPVAARQPVRSLWYQSSPTFIVPNYRPGHLCRADEALFDPQVVRALRDRLLPLAATAAPPAGGWPRRLWLARSKASPRRACNEAELLGQLATLGVVAVYPEELSAAQQIALFSQAELVVGPSGAAFANLLYCSPGCRAFILSQQPLDIGLFSGIARQLDVDLRYITEWTAPADPNVPLHADFTIDPRRARELVEAALARPGGLHG